MVVLRKSLLAALIILLRDSILAVHIVPEVVQGSWVGYYGRTYKEERRGEHIRGSENGGLPCSKISHDQ